MTLLWSIVRFLNGCVLALLLVQSVIYLWQLVVAFIELRHHRRGASRADPWWMLTSGVALPISILVPAHNEEETIVENVRSMLALLAMSAVLENFGYRQLNNLWRLEGIWQFLTGKQGWGAMQRTKFRKSAGT